MVHIISINRKYCEIKSVKNYLLHKFETVNYQHRTFMIYHLITAVDILLFSMCNSFFSDKKNGEPQQHVNVMLFPPILTSFWPYLDWLFNMVILCDNFITNFERNTSSTHFIFHFISYVGELWTYLHCYNNNYETYMYNHITNSTI